MVIESVGSFQLSVLEVSRSAPHHPTWVRLPAGWVGPCQRAHSPTTACTASLPSLSPQDISISLPAGWERTRFVLGLCPWRCTAPPRRRFFRFSAVPASLRSQTASSWVEASTEPARLNARERSCGAGSQKLGWGGRKGHK